MFHAGRAGTIMNAAIAMYHDQALDPESRRLDFENRGVKRYARPARSSPNLA